MWTKEEIKTLKKLYPNNLNINISEKLGRTKSSVEGKAFRLGLRKNKKMRSMASSMGGIKNENLTYDNIKKTALKYKTKIEFIRGDKNSYDKARRNGWLSKICEHMTVIRFSIPQLILRELLDCVLNTESIYNDRKTIKPYEIDIFYRKYNLGFEYQGYYWHLNNERDLIKNVVIKNKCVNIIYIYEWGRDYEKDIKTQLTDNLSIINNITGLTIKKEDINGYNIDMEKIYTKLYNKEELINIGRSYKDFKKFKNKEPNVVRKLYKLGLINEATSHMGDKISRCSRNIVDIKNTISKYNTLTDLRKNDLSLYKYIKKNDLNRLIKHLPKTKTTFSRGELLLEISKYRTKCRFRAENPKMCKFIYRNGFTDLLKNLNRC